MSAYVSPRAAARDAAVTLPIERHLTHTLLNTYADVCGRMLTYAAREAAVTLPIERHLTHTLLTSAYVSIRQHTSAYVSIRQHTSAHVI
jgi:hypothetical protein